MRFIITTVFSVLLLFLIACGNDTNNFAPETSASKDIECRDVTIGIAFKSDDPGSGTYDSVKRMVSRAGANCIILNKVMNYKLEYTNGKLASSMLDKDGIINTSAADIIKNSSYSDSNIEEVISGIDGVIFLGGEDVCPSLFSKPVPIDPGITDSERKYNPTRDVSDYLLMKYCLDNDIPLIGICRGMQMLGIVSGSEIIQDIPGYYKKLGKNDNNTHRLPSNENGKIPNYSPHDITITDRDSVIYRIFNSDTVHGAASWHHQAVIPGNNLKTTAITSVDGIDIVESVERVDKSFAIGYQFHPEASFAKNISNSADKASFMSENDSFLLIKTIVDALIN